MLLLSLLRHFNLCWSVQRHVSLVLEDLCRYNGLTSYVQIILRWVSCLPLITQLSPNLRKGRHSDCFFLLAASSLYPKPAEPDGATIKTPHDSLPTEKTSNLTHTSPSQQGTILSPGADPIPYRPVQQIRLGEFIEMRDLHLHSQLEGLHGQMTFSATPAAFHPRLREVPSLNSWMYCFATYMAVLTTDARTRELLAYCRLIIREATSHTGNGWQEYDRTFRRQAAIGIPFFQRATGHNVDWCRAFSACFVVSQTTLQPNVPLR